MNITEIREYLRQHELDAYVVAHGNRFIGQDILPQEHKIEFLCGFSGSAGIMAVTGNRVYLLVDGRYELQARREIKNSDVEIVETLPQLANLCDVLRKAGVERVAYDAWNHSVAEMETVQWRHADMCFQDVGDLVGIDASKEIKVMLRDVQFSGLGYEQKCSLVVRMLQEQNADYYLFTSSDSVSWLFNIYATDLPYTPVVRAYALLGGNGEKILISDYVQTDLLEVHSWAWFADFLKSADNVKILCDFQTMPEKLKMTAPQGIFIKAADVCHLLKAEKNAAELQGMIDCHVRDGAALVKLLYWLENNWRGKTEMDVVRRLHQFRAEQQNFFSESFATIAGAGANGAIVHYQPHEGSDAPLLENELLLLDSGGQYLDGTTDVTRTVVLGAPNKDMVQDFTMVLKAHIKLASACFPINTSGKNLDVLARAELWKYGSDYKHGTGHGVACFGNVHEGPIGISVGYSDYGFRNGMVVSNEPGVYREGKYGIRIENLMYATAAEHEGFLRFCHLTKVPIDKRLIDAYLLNDEEQAWLNAYHQDVYESLAPYLDENEKIWLKDACSPL